MSSVLSVILMWATLTTGLSVQPTAQASERLIHVTVTERSNRFVTGLKEQDFEIVANGVVRPITFFSGSEAAISVAIVGDVSADAVRTTINPGDELIQTLSLADALSRLSASRNSRKALILVGAVDAGTIPRDVIVFRTDPDNLRKTILQARSQYVMRFTPADPADSVQVVIKLRDGWPVMNSSIF